MSEAEILEVFGDVFPHGLDRDFDFSTFGILDALGSDTVNRVLFKFRRVSDEARNSLYSNIYDIMAEYLSLRELALITLQERVPINPAYWRSLISQRYPDLLETYPDILRNIETISAYVQSPLPNTKEGMKMREDVIAGLMMLGLYTNFDIVARSITDDFNFILGIILGDYEYQYVLDTYGDYLIHSCMYDAIVYLIMHGAVFRDTSYVRSILTSYREDPYALHDRGYMLTRLLQFLSTDRVYYHRTGGFGNVLNTLITYKGKEVSVFHWLVVNQPLIARGVASNPHLDVGYVDSTGRTYLDIIDDSIGKRGAGANQLALLDYGPLVKLLRRRE